MNTIQTEYNLIKEGKGNKQQLLKQARTLFPGYFNQYTTYNTAISVLKSKGIISEVGGVVSKGFDIWDWKKILTEETKAEEKKVSKEVEKADKNAFNDEDVKNPDNINFNEIMKGFYTELKDEKNQDKTPEELKKIVLKNLSKDCCFYTKDGEFGTKGVGYKDNTPGLSNKTQPKTKESTTLGGHDKVETDSDIVKDSLVGSAKKNVKDTLSDSEAKVNPPKKVKVMDITPQNSKGVKKMDLPGKEKKIKLKETIEYIPEEEVEEGMYQGRIVSPKAGGSLGGKRFIPNVTVISKKSVDDINRQGEKRINWNKPHIKLIKKDDETRMLVSQMLVDTIGSAQRGRSALSINVSKAGTGITPNETQELSGEFKKLIKVLNANNKLVKNGEYYLLDLPVKYNEKRDQYELPLPSNVAEELEENSLRSLISKMIKEEIKNGY